jgi:hypothetical protein
MFKGTLDDFTLADIFRLLSLSKKTGRLHVERKAGSGTVYFRDGEVYFAESSLSREPLGQKLIRSGGITEGALRKALDQHHDSGERVGDILVSTGAVTLEQIETAVGQQIEDAVFDLLRWELGEYEWQTNVGVEVEVEVQISVENLIMEASRRLDELEVIRRKVSSMDAILAMAPKPPEGALEINITPEEWRVLVLVDGSRTLQDIADMCGLDDFQAMRTVYGLISAGLVEVADSGEVTERVVAGEAVTEWEAEPVPEAPTAPVPVAEAVAEEPLVVEPDAEGPEPVVEEVAPDAAGPEPVAEIAPEVEVEPDAGGPEPVVEEVAPEPVAEIAPEVEVEPEPVVEEVADAEGPEVELEPEPEPVFEVEVPEVHAEGPDVPEIEEEIPVPAEEADEVSVGAGEPPAEWFDDPNVGIEAFDAPSPEELTTEVPVPEAPNEAALAAELGQAPSEEDLVPEADAEGPEPAGPDDSFLGDLLSDEPLAPDEPAPQEVAEAEAPGPEAPTPPPSVDRAAVVRELAGLFSDEEATPRRSGPTRKPGEGAPDEKKRVEDDDQVTKGLISRLIDGVKGL